MSVKHLQKCYMSPSKPPKLLPSASNPLNNQGYDKGSFLIYRGEDTGYSYTAVDDRLSIFKSNGYIENSNLAFTISFGPDATVVDCVYFPLSETCPGLAVAVFDPSMDNKHKFKFYLAYVSLTKKRVLRKIAAPGSVNSICNIIDGITCHQQNPFLNSTLQKWPHVIAVSIYGQGAALTHLAIATEDDDESGEIKEKSNVVILGKAFFDRNDDGKYHFKSDDGREHRGKRSNFYVTKFCFMEPCGIVVMGFPFGGIYMVSLRTQRPYAYFMAEGVIEDIAIQYADDDPRGWIFTWFALSKGEKGYAFCCQAQFGEEEEKSKLYNRPFFSFGPNFQLSNFLSFISLKIMKVDRSRLAGGNKHEDVNESIAVNGISTSLAIFTWLSNTRPARVYGAVYDLNMFYYKSRAQPRLVSDNTMLSQLTSISGFLSDDSVDVANMEIFDLVLMPKSLHAFVSVNSEDKDALFFPSVYSFTLKALTRHSALYLHVISIQDQFLKDVSQAFPTHFANPEEMCQKFHALGIGALPFEGNDKRYYLLSTLLKHGYHFCIADFILNSNSTIVDLKFLVKWLNCEVESSKELLDKSSQPLFDGSEVSHAAMHYIKFSESFYLRICQIIDAMIARVEKLLPEEETMMNTLKIASSLTSGLYLYAIGIKFGIDYKLLPQTSKVFEINGKLKKIFKERRTSSATLSIMRLIKDCMETISERNVWNNESAEEWYPPQAYSTWLGIFLSLKLSKTAKATLFGYYLYDLNKSGLVTEEKLLDKGLGYFLLTDTEKLLAIKRRIEKMYKADDLSARQLDQDDVVTKVMLEMKAPEDIAPKTLSDFDNLPLITQDQIETAKRYFLTLPHGIHLWNKSVIDKRRYELILPTDAPKGDEPAVVSESRKRVKMVQQQQPWLFRENPLFDIVKLWADATNANVSKEIAPEIISRNIEILAVPSSRKRTIDEVIDIEEDEFELRTPIKQGRKSIFTNTPAAKAFREIESGASPNENDITISPVVNTDIDKKTMTNKQWERIRQITKTPPSTPMVSRFNISPEPSSVKPPTSILKSAKSKSRITPGTKRTRLQFEANISRFQAIPNREEQKAPLPDAFTMDDSVISEIEVQEEPLDLNDSSDDKEADLSYGPVKLDFDNLDEEEENELPEESKIPEEMELLEERESERILHRSFEEQQDPDIDEKEENELPEEPKIPEEKELLEEKKSERILHRSFEEQQDPDIGEEEENDLPEESGSPMIVLHQSTRSKSKDVADIAEQWRLSHRRPERQPRKKIPLEESDPPMIVLRRSTRSKSKDVAEVVVPPKSPRKKSSAMDVISEAPESASPRRSTRSKSKDVAEVVVPPKSPRKKSSAMDVISEAPELASPRRSTRSKSKDITDIVVPPKSPRKKSSAMDVITEAPESASPRRSTRSKSKDVAEVVVPPKSPRKKSSAMDVISEAPELASPRRSGRTKSSN